MVMGLLPLISPWAGTHILVPSRCGAYVGQGSIYLANHPGEAKRMEERGRHYVIKHFNRTEPAAEFIHLVETLVKCL